MLFYGDAPLVAFSSLVAVLGSSEGRNLYKNNKAEIEPHKEFRVIARNKGISGIRNESDGFYQGYPVGSEFLEDYRRGALDGSSGLGKR